MEHGETAHRVPPLNCYHLFNMTYTVFIQNNNNFHTFAQPVALIFSSFTYSDPLLTFSLKSRTKIQKNMRTNLHLLLLLSLAFYLSFSNGTQLLIVNNCKESIWPGILGTAGHETPNNGGFHLKIGQQVVIELPNLWSGRIWGRQGCCFDENGKGSCQTGDCSGLLHCSGAGGIPPATLVEMTLGTSNNPQHYYDVSLVDGFNIPVAMIPIGGSAGCGVAACEADLNECCPAYLAIKCKGKVVGCKSACLATNDPIYCCTGEFASKNTCKPTAFSRLFKTICPRSYSYAFDESTGLKSCKAPRYLITFCPPT